MLDLYIDNGGNFVDTANFYTNGSSEKMLGEFLGEKRSQIVLSKLEQLENNLGSLNTPLSPDQIKRLDDISRVEMGFPHAILANPTIKQTISGGVEVHRK